MREYREWEKGTCRECFFLSLNGYAECMEITFIGIVIIFLET